MGGKKLCNDKTANISDIGGQPGTTVASDV